MKTPAKKATTKKAAVKKATPLMQKSVMAKKKQSPVKQMETIKEAGKYLGKLKDKVVKRISNADIAGDKAYGESAKPEKTLFTNVQTGVTRNPAAYVGAFAKELINPKTSKKKKG